MRRTPLLLPFALVPLPPSSSPFNVGFLSYLCFVDGGRIEHEQNQHSDKRIVRLVFLNSHNFCSYSCTYILLLMLSGNCLNHHPPLSKLNGIFGVAFRHRNWQWQIQFFDSSSLRLCRISIWRSKCIPASSRGRGRGKTLLSVDAVSGSHWHTSSLRIVGVSCVNLINEMSSTSVWRRKNILA